MDNLETTLTQTEINRFIELARTSIPMNKEDRLRLCSYLGLHSFKAVYFCEKKDRYCPKDSAMFNNLAGENYCQINLLIAYHIANNTHKK